MTEQEYKQLIQGNIRVITSLDGLIYPYLNTFLTKRKGAMLSRLLRLLDLFYSTENQTYYSKKWYCFASDEHIAEFGRNEVKNVQAWFATTRLFLAIGLIQRHKLIGSNIEKGNKYMQDSIRRSEESGRLPIGYWTTAEYTPQLLHHAEKMAGRWVASGVSLRNFNKETVIVVFGQKLADKIYTHTGKISRKNTEIEGALVEAAQELISAAGFTTRQELLRHTANKLSHHSHMDIYTLLCKRGAALLKPYGITYHQPTKAQIERYQLATKQWIYLKPVCKNGT